MSLKPRSPAHSGTDGRCTDCLDSLDTVSFVFGTIPPEDEYTPQVQSALVEEADQYPDNH